MKKAVFLLFLATTTLIGFSQENWSVEGMHHGEPMQRFIAEIQRSLPLRFFYLEPWIDSVNMVQSSSGEKLTSILDHTLPLHRIGYMIMDHRIVLFPEGSLDTSKLVSFRLPDPSVSAGPVISYEESDRSTDAGSPANTDITRVISIGRPDASSEGEIILNGYVREAVSGEPVIGAVVYSEDQQRGVTTDANGYYVISLRRGRHQMTYRSIGKQLEERVIQLNGEGTLNIEMEEKVTQLKGVVITADKYQNVTGMQVGLNKLDVEVIRQMPASMGEADVLKAALLLPGVQTVGEGASGFNVRGGSTDQNLVLINEAPVFNTSHLFGFFSAFNPDVIREFKLFKSGIPAEYGGRIASVFDITTRNGNRKSFAGQGGISPVTGRLMLEGPIVSEKASFVAGGRSTYSDWILKRINDPSIRNSDASFYDLNGKISWDVNKNNQLDVSAYYSKDYFRLNSDTSYHYSNANVVAGWKHIFTSKLIGKFTGLVSSYQYNISSESREDQAFTMQYRVTQMEGKAGFSYFLNADHRVQFGLNLIHYRMQPGSYSPSGPGSVVAPMELENERAFETALYLSDEIRITPELSVYAGIRYSLYNYLGPKTVHLYYPDVPLDPAYLKDTVHYGKGAFIQTYTGPEWRLNLRYSITPSSSLKLSYNRLRQYLSMLSNTTSISPTDTWKLSDPHIRPQTGDQLAIGFYQDFRSQRIETSVEAYYKHIRNMIEYKGGAQLLFNEFLEQDLINATGRGYGVELMVKRTAGKLNGWVSYAYSRILVRTESEFPEDRINGGEWFPANHDKPHEFTMVLNHKFSRRFSISSNLIYSTGRPITYPTSRYTVRNMTLINYTYRNEYRIPDYFRWDLAINLEGNLRSKKLAHSSWSFSVYNVTGRDNVYSIYFISQEKNVQGYRLSVFTRPVFTLTYNFRF